MESYSRDTRWLLRASFDTRGRRSHFPNSGMRGKYQVPIWNGVVPKANSMLGLQSWDSFRGSYISIETEL